MQLQSLVLPSSDLRCIPVGIQESKKDTGPRLGGRPPADVFPPQGESSYSYFMTVPLAKEPYREVSVFVQSLDSLLSVSGVLQKLGRVQIVVHDESVRGPTSSLMSGLSEHTLSLRPEQDDWVESYEGDRLIAPFSKIGGRPHLAQPKDELCAALKSAKSSGFRHFVQIDFPGGPFDKDLVKGNWPFADGIFHLFYRLPLCENDWRWFFEL